MRVTLDVLIFYKLLQTLDVVVLATFPSPDVSFSGRQLKPVFF